MGRQNPADHILVNVDPEGLGDLLGNSGTTPPRIAPLELEDRLNQVGRGPFGPGLLLRVEEKRSRYLRCLSARMKRNRLEGLRMMMVRIRRRGDSKNDQRQEKKISRPASSTANSFSIGWDSPWMRP